MDSTPMERVISGLDQVLHPIEKKKNPFWTGIQSHGGSYCPVNLDSFS